MNNMSKSSGLARFLASLFALVMLFGLTAAAPAPTSDIVESKQLAARTTTLIRMGETRFLPTAKGNKYGSYGFDSCIGIMCYGKTGVLLGHYSCSEYSIADGGELGNIQGVNQGAAIHAIPAAIAPPNSLGADVKCYIFAQDGTPQERITEMTNVLTGAGLPAPKLKTYKKVLGAKQAGFTLDVGHFMTTKTWDELV